MPKKTKIEKMRSPSKAAVRSRFEERILTVYSTDSDKREWIVRKDPSGAYVNPTIQERWLGFLLAYDKGPHGLAIQEASPFVTRITRDMRALALELKALAAGSRENNGSHTAANSSGNEVTTASASVSVITTSDLLDNWADDIEARPDALYEDVYEQLVEMIDPQVSHSGPRGDRPFPPSVVETMRFLVDHYNATRSAQDISTQHAGMPTVAESTPPAIGKLSGSH